MNDVKALILCNNPISIPGIREFLFYGKVAVIATTRKNKEMQHILQQYLKDTDVPLLLVNKNDYKTQLATAIKEYKATIGLMMTFPFIITPELLSLPPKGFINFHYGLLPQCRGPQPILRHMLNNDTHTGVTIHVVDEGVDTGGIVSQEKIPIENNDTYGILQTKLAYLGAKQAANLLKILSYGSIIPATKQDESLAAYYEMPTAEELTIKWSEMTAAEIIRLINTCNPWNKGAGTTIKEWVMGITAAEIIGDSPADEKLPGTIIHSNSTDGLQVKTKDDKLLKITIVYTSEGFFTGERMADFGLVVGETFS